MKRQILLSATLLLLVFSCKDKDQALQSQIEKINQLEAENETLKEKADNSQQSLNDFMEAFNDINQNLEEIKQKEELISMTAQSMEYSSVRPEKIQEDIFAIYDLLRENKETVEALRNKMEASDMINDEMQRSLDLLGKAIEEKNEQIIRLRTRMENLNSEMQSLNDSIDSLYLENELQYQKLKAQEDILNTGYYIVGNSRELFQIGITTRKGGFIGIGNISQIDEHFESRFFKKINIHEIKRIPVNAKKARILSTHPAQAYKFDGPSDFYNNLIITRPEKFWSTSRYLVIEIDN